MPEANEPMADEFVDQLGLSLEEDGLPRIAGRLFALFLIEGGPLSFSELAERLQVSRGSISNNARLLRALGVIDRVIVAGSRQDHYRLADDPYRRLLDGYVARMQQRLGIIDHALRAKPKPERAARKRLEDLDEFYKAAIENTQALTARWQRQRAAR